MFRVLFLSVVLAVSTSASALAAGSLDLTPIVREVPMDGATRQLVFFRSAHVGFGRLSLVEYAPPWPITGAHETATMSVPGKDASVSIKSVENADSLDLADETAAVEWVSKAIPKGATGLHIDRVEKDPVKLNGHPTIEVTLSFDLYGRALQISAFLCRRRGDRQPELFLFQVAAHPRCFTEVHAAFRSSLYSIVGF